MLKYSPNASLLVVEQLDDKPFNRGALLNIGYLESVDSCYVFHDVDMLPVQVDYSLTTGVTQLALSKIQAYDYLGGVTMFGAETFRYLNGYPNDFERAEDNCMMFTIKRAGIRVNYRPGIYQLLNHERPKLEFDPVAWIKAQQVRKPSEGLSGISYTVLERKEECGFTTIQVLT